jgi:hypothetical protein
LLRKLMLHGLLVGASVLVQKPETTTVYGPVAVRAVVTDSGSPIGIPKEPRVRLHSGQVRQVPGSSSWVPVQGLRRALHCSRMRWSAGTAKSLTCSAFCACIMGRPSCSRLLVDLLLGQDNGAMVTEMMRPEDISDIGSPMCRYQLEQCARTFGSS